MKKLLLIFTILLISLAVSACSSKFNYNGSENESINEFNSEAKSDNSKSQEDLDLVKSNGEPQAVFTRENDPEVKTFECLSLIHISEPTRRTPISYAVFCL